MPKPSSSIVKQYRVRIDGNDDERIIEFCKKFYGKCLLVRHDTETENPHYHFYGETTKTQGNMSNLIKSELGVTGGDYSNKKCDPDRALEYLQYLFNTKKGNKYKLLLNQDFSPIDVEIYRANAQQVADEYATRMKTEKKTQYELVMMIIERVGDDRCCFTEIVYEETISALKASHMIARPYQVRDLIATVMAYADNRQSKEKVKDLTLKFFSQ